MFRPDFSASAAAAMSGRARALMLAAALATVFGSTATSNAAGAAELPLRKAGRWHMTTVMDEGAGPKERTLTMCIDADMERNTAANSKAEHEKNCSLYEIKKDGDATIVDATCLFDARKVESHTRMSGDFETNFDIEIKSTTSGTEYGKPVSVQRTITQKGEYLGADCKDLQAGEAMGSDGSRVMVQ